MWGHLWFVGSSQNYKKIYPENMKEIVGAVWELPAKQLSPFPLDFFSYLIKNPQTTNAPTFLTHIISAIGGVCSGHWADYLPTYLTWTIVEICLCTYLPHLVHVVFEQPPCVSLMSFFMCSSDLKYFANSGPTVSNFKSFS